MTTNAQGSESDSDLRSLPQVAHLDETPAITLSAGVTLRELTGRKVAGSSQTHQSSVAHFRLEPGRASAWSHNKMGEESFFILSGSGAVWIGAHSQPVTAGSFVVIPPDLVRSVRASETEALEYFALTTPAWSVDDDVHVPAPEGAPV